MSDVDWEKLRERIALAEAATAKLLNPSEAENERILEDRARRLAARVDAEVEGEIELAFFRSAGEAFAVESRGVASVLAAMDTPSVSSTHCLIRRTSGGGKSS